MSVAGVGSSVDLYSILQSVNGSSQGAGSASSIASTNDPDGDGDGTQAASGHHHGYHHGGGGNGISSKIETAVTDALNNAPPGSDPNQVIESAIQGVLTGGNDTTSQQAGTSPIGNSSTQSAGGFNQLLQSHGIDPQQFHQDFQAAVQNVGEDGTVDFARLFQGFPPGSAVDAVG